jgi:hypothetical protein
MRSPSAQLSQPRDEWGGTNDFFPETGLPGGLLNRDVAGNGKSLYGIKGTLKQEILVNLPNTGAINASAQLVDAIADAPENSLLLIPGGDILLEEEVHVTKPIAIQSVGRAGTHIHVAAGISGIVIDDGVNNFSLHGCFLESEGRLRAPGTAGIKAIAADLAHSIGGLSLSEVGCYGFEHGVHAEFCQKGRFRDLSLDENYNGLYIKRCVNIRGRGIAAEGNTFYGIYLDGTEGNPELSCGILLSELFLLANGALGGGNLYVTDHEGVYIGRGILDVPAAGHTGNVKLIRSDAFDLAAAWIGNTVENNAIAVRSCRNFRIRGLDVIASLLHGLNLDDCHDYIVKGNTFSQGTSADIYITNASGAGSGGSIEGNTLASTTPANSIEEIGANGVVARGNRHAKPITIHATSVKEDNFDLATNAASPGENKTITGELRVGSVGPTGFPARVHVATDHNLVVEESALGAQIRGTNDANNVTKPVGMYLPFFSGVPVFANNAAAIAGGLTGGRAYRTGGDPDQLCVVH